MSERSSTSSSSTPDDSPELDESRLAALSELEVGAGCQFRRALLVAFESATLHQFAELRRGIESGDPEVVARAAHGLKGSASNLGAVRLARGALEVERLALGEGQLPGRSVIAALEGARDRTLAALRRLWAGD